MMGVNLMLSSVIVFIFSSFIALVEIGFATGDACDKTLQASVQVERQRMATQLANFYLNEVNSKSDSPAARARFATLLNKFDRLHPGIQENVSAEVDRLKAWNLGASPIVPERVIEAESWNQLVDEERRRWDVCQRSPSVRKLIEFWLKKPCSKIGEEDLAEIKNFYTKGDQIEVLDEYDLYGMTNLSMLWISECGLRRIHPRAFQSLSSLSLLHLDYNKLEDLDPELFRDLNELEKVYLDSNRLGEIHPGQFRHNSKLWSLGLGGNLLTQVDIDSLLGLKSLRHVMLDGNPISFSERAKAELKINEARSFGRDLTLSFQEKRW